MTYFGMLFLAQAPYMVWIFWWQLIGTSAMQIPGHHYQGSGPGN
jgi:hypothetical protein